MPDENLSSQVQKEQETVSASSSNNSKKWMKVVLLGAVGLLVAAGLVYVGYWYSQNSNLKAQKLTPQVKTQNLTPTQPLISTPTSTPDPTADWETYKNTKYKYELKYPSEFQVFEQSADSVRVSNNLPPDPSCKGGGCNLEIPRLSLYFEHLDNIEEDQMNLDEYANARRTALLGISNDQSQIEKIRKFGLDVRFMEGITEGYHQSYFMKLNPTVSFAITVVFPSKEDINIYKNTADQILSTFQFLD